MKKEKIAIVTDSSSSLDYLRYDDYDNIYMVRMPIFFGDVEYIDGKTITVEDFYQRLETEDIIPSTSQPSLGETLDLYEALKAEGYTDIIHFPISKGLSGVYQSLFSICNVVEDINIHIVDTRSTAIILGFTVLEAARIVKEGKTVSEVLAYSDYLSTHFKPYFMVDDLKYLIKNGRLSNAAGFIGSVLKIKPILTFNENGEIVGIEKIRTTKKAMNHIIQKVLEETKEFKKIQYFMAYGHDQALIEDFRVQVAEAIPSDQIMDCILPSVIGAHVGSGIVALGYFVLEK